MSDWTPLQIPRDRGHKPQRGDNEFNISDGFHNSFTSQNYQPSADYYNTGMYTEQQGFQSQPNQFNFPQEFNAKSTNYIPPFANTPVAPEWQAPSSSASYNTFNSNLTPLAQEFTPSQFNVPQNSLSFKSDKRNGAVKKNAYWNSKGTANYTSDRQNNYRHNNSTKAFKQNEGLQKSNRVDSGNRRNRPGNKSYFNKSEEQSKALQDTIKFLQQVNCNDNKKPSENVYEANSYPSRNYEGISRSSSENFANLKSSSDNKFGLGDCRSNSEGFANIRPSSMFAVPDGRSGGENFANCRPSTFVAHDKRDRAPYNKSFDAYGKNNNKNSFTRKGFQDYGVKDNLNQAVDEGRSSYGNKNVSKENRQKMNKKKLDSASQRERLEQLIIRRQLECLVCCEKLRHTDRIWTCIQCYHILHLQCIKRWAHSSKLESGWRCPACQNVYQTVPQQYHCFCGKTIEPQAETGGIPHSCGEVCGRKGRTCIHTCTLLCHPGPCPECSAMVPRSCGCGSTKPIVKCSSNVPIKCKNVCGKTLECGGHLCTKICHDDECGSCPERVKQECYCGKVGRKVDCTAETRGVTHYECGELCDKMLSCGNHKCQRVCHDGDCSPCVSAPDQVNSCPCGQTQLVVIRSSCLDPVPCCDKICNKLLKCGQPSSPHICKVVCHGGPCPPCPLSTLVRCRCGHMDKELPCVELTTKADDARCEKKCTKKRLCAKHKCNQLCCIELEHICPLPCNRMLSCGQHRCEDACHKGRCQPCWRSSFEELYCECGNSVLDPPVRCGTRPPPCNQPCSRPRTCDHDVLHSCHTGPCPPCTVLTKRWCYGHHEQRSTIPCHQDDFGCGRRCGRDMSCGKHKCIQPCHSGDCPSPCTQPCEEPRASCGHPCGQPCHKPPCLETPCKFMVKVTCECGLRSSSRTCMDLAGEYQSIAMVQLASKIEEMQRGYSVDISDITGGVKRQGSLKTLECTDECRLVERNRRLAIGLQIRNPDLSAKLTPRYSEFMRGWAKKDPKFCQYVHNKLTELVQLAKQSKQKSRSYSFETMNRDKRHFVHEYCEHFGSESAAYDPEPNRNVVATAFKDKSWLPSYSLLEVIQRENGQRKVPGPQQLSKSTGTKAETVSLKLPGRVPRPATPPGEYIDYFNNPPE